MLKTNSHKTIILSVILALISFVPYVSLHKNAGISLDDLLFVVFILVSMFIVNWRELIKNKNALIFPFVFLILLALISSVYNALGWKDLFILIFKGPFKIFLFFVLITLCQNIFNSLKKTRILLLILLIASFLQSLFCISSFIFKYEGPFRTGSIESNKYSAILGNADRRAVGTFGSEQGDFLGSNLLGSYLILFLPLSIYFFYSAKQKRSKIFFGAVFLCQALSSVLTYNRSSFLIIFLGFIALSLILKNYKLFFLVFGLGLLVFFFWPGMYDRFLLDQFDRIIIWRQAISVSLNNFWFGIGAGNYLRELISQALDYNLLIKTSAHNGFLNIFAELGFGSLLCFVWIIFLYLKKIFQVFVMAKKNLLALSISLSAFMFILQNVFNNFFFIATVSVYFWLFYVLLVNITAEKTVVE